MQAAQGGTTMSSSCRVVVDISRLVLFEAVFLLRVRTQKSARLASQDNSMRCEL